MSNLGSNQLSRSFSNLHVDENNNITNIEEDEHLDFQLIDEKTPLNDNEYQNDDAGTLNSLQDDITNYSDEIQEVIEETNKYLKDNTISISITPIATETIADEFNEANEYEPSFDRESNNFSIKLGTNELPRFSCANHKNNIAVRLAIKKSSSFSSLLMK